MEEIKLGSSQDYFENENSFSLSGYLSLPQNATTLIVLHPDIFGLGSDAFTRTLAESLASKGIGLLSFDNSGSSSFGGKSDGVIRDYLPDQMLKDLYCTMDFITNDPRFSEMKIVLAGYSYGAIPASIISGEVIADIDGLLLISPPEKGMDIFEKVYKGIYTEEKDELDEKVWKIKDASGKELKLSGLFFSDKRKALNTIPIMEIVHRVAITPLPVRVIFGGADDLLEISNVNNKEPFVIIDEARHDFSNKWDELTEKISAFCANL